MKCFVLTCSLSLALFSQTALPQSSSQNSSLSLEEIIVTAQKREQNLQDVPLSVSAFDGDTLREMGVVDFTNLSTRLNNVIISADQDNLDIAIRGISNNRGFDPATAFHIDGIYTSRGVSGLLAFLDVDRLEVIRGPAGTLYGRNATAGAVNVISRRPNSEELSGHVEFTLGNYDHLNMQFGVNVPLIEDVLALRVSALYDDREGYTEHDGLGFDLENSDDSDVNGTKLRLLFTPNEQISWLLGYESSDVGGAGKRLLIDPPRSSAGTQVLNRLPNLDPAIAQRILDDPRFVPATDPITEDIEQSAWMSEFRYDTEAFSLIYLAGLRDLKQRRLSDTDFYIGENFVVDSFQDSTESSHELRISGDTEKLQWLLGLYYFKAESDTGFEQVIFPGFANFSDFADSQEESIGVFTQATYALNDTLRMTLGLRYNEDEKTPSIFRQRFGNPNNIDLSTVDPGPRGDSIKFDDVSWKASLEWDVDDNSLLYLTASTGYKTGGFSSDPDQSKFDEETVLAWELGSKNQFMNGRLQLNGAIFWYDYEGLQVSGLRTELDANGDFIRAFNVQDNIAGVDVFGAELDWIWVASNNVQVDGGIALLSAEVDTGRVDDTLTSDDDAAGGVEVSGNTLRKSPEFSFNLGIQHEIALGEGALRSRLDFHYEDEQSHDVINRPIDTEDSYTKTDLSITYEAPNRQWFVQAFVRNIEDDDIRTSIFQTPLGGISQFAPPRTYGIRGGIDF